MIGFLCGGASLILDWLIGRMEHIFWGEQHPSIEYLQSLAWWQILLIPALGGLLVGPVIYFFSRESRGHGVPEVMLAVGRKNGIIRPRVAVVKAIASALTISSGGAAGREGPIIQIGAAIGSSIGQAMKVSRRKMRVFVGCGAAGGIAATFNAPIAGALFAVEVILAEFGVAQFSPIVISSVIATVVARHTIGTRAVHFAPNYELVNTLELIPYALLGVFCGLISVLFSKVLVFTEEYFEEQKKVPEWLQPAIGGLGLGMLGIFLPQVFGDGHDAVNLSILNSFPWFLLVLLLFGKIVGTSLSLGSGGSGGVFSPALFIGAMAGALVGQGVAALFGASAGSPGGYALVGMAGMVAGTMHAPITAILIIFEVTNNYSVILPLMTVSIISIVVSSMLQKENIYTVKMAKSGIQLFQKRTLNFLRDYRVKERIRDDYETVGSTETVDRLVERLMDTEKSHFYVIDDENCLRGVLELDDLGRVLTQHQGLEHILLAEDIAEEGLPVLLADEPLSHAMTQFERSGTAELPVVNNREKPKLIGILKYSDILAVYNRVMMNEDPADNFAERIRSLSSGHRVRIMDNFSMMEWDPPQSLWGKTLGQAQLPSRYQIRVILIKHNPDGAGSESAKLVPVIPGKEYLISNRDTFVIYGKDEDLNRVNAL